MPLLEGSLDDFCCFRATLGAAAVAAIAGSTAIAPAAHAQTDAIALVVDASGSMEGAPLQEAQEALRSTVNNLPAGQTVSLRSYEGDCNSGGRLLVPAGTNNRAELHNAINNLSAGGGTPTPSALRAAYADLPNNQGTIVLVSDGQSTCGDPCVTARQLAQTGTQFRVHTVGYKLSQSDAQEMQCVANATGGKFVPVADGRDLAYQINIAVNHPNNFGDLVGEISSLRDALSSDPDEDAGAGAGAGSSASSSNSSATSSQSSHASSRLSSDEAVRNQAVGVIIGTLTLISTVVALISQIMGNLPKF